MEQAHCNAAASLIFGRWLGAERVREMEWQGITTNFEIHEPQSIFEIIID